MQVGELLGRPFASADGWSSGLAGLDDLLGGLRAGSLWVVTGAPSSGKSVLLTQLACRLAMEHSVPTDLFCARIDDVDLLRSRLLSLAVHRLPAVPALAVPLADLSPSQQAALTALEEAPLRAHTGGGFWVERPRDADACWCLAIDDPEGKRPPVLDLSGRRELRRVADEGAVVLVSVPRSLCLEPDSRTGAGERLREEWASVADLVVELVPGEPGTATLVVWQNRRGPLRDVSLTYLANQARFVDGTKTGQRVDLTPGHA